MQYKWLAPIIVVLALLLAVGLAAAQEEATAEPEATAEAVTTTTSIVWRHGHLPVDAILEATGLTVTELRTALADGSTIAELIEANGGDVDAFVAEWVSVQETALADYETALTSWLNGEVTTIVGFGSHDGVSRNDFGGRNGLDTTALLEATGLTATELRTALADGSTIAELVAANGGDLEALIADSVTAYEERLATSVLNGRITQEEADAALVTYEENLTAYVNGETVVGFNDGLRDSSLGRGFDFDGRNGLATTAILEATGLTATELRTALADGSTIAELVAANDGDLDALVADAVAVYEERLATSVLNGRITQEEADTLLATYEENVTAWLNGELTTTYGLGDGNFGGGREGGRGGRGGGGR